ncbi:Putative fluoride ion transporter CrcB [Jeotgalicoccus saudimassiliensis]|uniref:Fluoride-specific ion channel FluC n=1 Tax=Jeotgalicoccus saudimassiliensis TaxID=1461582 RepID=A0A078M0M7_9STAP|nr:CrcB family protein [Jeotgalicoccus saudimassiliensis]CEA00928.1 Putative fluoride ion transporter CrcB [Jeotgalicoccus saudimassiliensis]
MLNILTMMVAAALGACLRAYINELPVFKDKDMPYNTMTVNILGAFLMGFVVMLVTANTQYYLIIITGFSGGFTTYSQFALDQFNLLREKKTKLFFKYSLSTIFFTLVAVAFGLIAGSMFV